jgi:alpha-L-arabinofuranosidase
MLRPIDAGEYATIQPNILGGGGTDWNSSRSVWPFWIGTVAEAVFLIGAERNTDGIIGASYAPLLQNLNSYEWAPDLISFSADPALDVESTSFHLIELFSGTRMTETLPTTADQALGPVYWVAGQNEDTGNHIFKACVYNSTQISKSSTVPIKLTFKDVDPGTPATLTVLTAPDGYSHNEPGVEVVKTQKSTIRAGSNGAFSFTLPDLSIAVLETRE